MNVFPPVLHFAYDPIFQKKKKHESEWSSWMNEVAANANKRNWAQEMESASSLGKTKLANYTSSSFTLRWKSIAH